MVSPPPDSAPDSTKPSVEDEPARGRKGRETRAALLQAAREVFERDGFLEARIVDITETAGLATGSFYTYFRDKRDAFAAVLTEVQGEMLHPGVHNAFGHEDPVKLIEASNRIYLEGYRRNAKLMALLEQVAMIDDEFRSFRRERSQAFAARNVRSLERLQQAGKIDPGLDLNLIGVSLGAMVSRVAFLTFVLETDEVDFDELVATLTTIWIRALQAS